MLRREAVDDARVAAVARDGEDHVAARAFLADDGEVCAVGQPFGVADFDVVDAGAANGISCGCRVTAPVS